ncbi:MAG: flagellin lysine-N-methylase [Clostridia bacterium]|nr:flagellin lysine-N-methylase [Clostridia bacterium]
MKTVIPHYYTQFRCIADRCVHCCCIGWEIDVDADTLARYRTVGGALGKRLAAQIVDGAFVLDAQERCPFLNAQGLCDIITELGEDALCEICAEHPRFRSFYSDREEIGLGLCCEEAARMVLTQTPPASFIETGSEQPTPEEQAFFAFRKRLLSVVQDRSQPLSARLQAALDMCGAAVPDRDWAAVYRALERLDESWTPRLAALQLPPPPLAPEWDVPLEQLAVYFLFRHLPGALEDGRLAERVAFTVLSTQVLQSLFAAGEQSMAALIELARAYSAEIEYSDENVDTLLCRLSR